MMWLSLIWVMVATLTLLLTGVAWGRRLETVTSGILESDADPAVVPHAGPGHSEMDDDLATSYEDDHRVHNPQRAVGHIACWSLLGWAALVVLVPVGLSLQVAGPGSRVWLLMVCVMVQGGLLCGAASRLSRLARGGA